MSAALDAHRVGERKALQNATVMKRQLADCIEDRNKKISDYAARCLQLEQERQLLQNKYAKSKEHRERLNER